MKLKKIGVLSLGYAGAIATFIMALFQVLMIYLQSKIPVTANMMDPTIAAVLQGKGLIIMLIVTPLVGLIAGFIGGVVMAAIYDFIIAPISGGVNFEFEDHKKR